MVLSRRSTQRDGGLGLSAPLATAAASLDEGRRRRRARDAAHHGAGTWLDTKRELSVAGIEDEKSLRAKIHSTGNAYERADRLGLLA